MSDNQPDCRLPTAQELAAMAVARVEDMDHCARYVLEDIQQHFERHPDGTMESCLGSLKLHYWNQQLIGRWLMADTLYDAKEADGEF